MRYVRPPHTPHAPPLPLVPMLARSIAVPPPDDLLGRRSGVPIYLGLSHLERAPHARQQPEPPPHPPRAGGHALGLYLGAPGLPPQLQALGEGQGAQQEQEDPGLLRIELRRL